MCCRYTVTITAQKIAKKFNAALSFVLYHPNFNAAPSQNLPVIKDISPHEISLLKWGLVPSWAKDPKIGHKLCNARAETILEKNTFKDSFKTKRCLVLADGFYEWKETKSQGKIPYRIIMKNKEPFAFAGIWSSWNDPETKIPLETFAIITTEPTSLIKEIHDRMPVILKEEDFTIWLNPKTSLVQAQSLLKPYPAKEMMAYEVSKKINSPVNNFPEVIKPVIK